MAPTQRELSRANPTSALTTAIARFFQGLACFSVTMSWWHSSTPVLDWVHNLRRYSQESVQVQVLRLGCHSLADAQHLPSVRRPVSYTHLTLPTIYSV